MHLLSDLSSNSIILPPKQPSNSLPFPPLRIGRIGRRTLFHTESKLNIPTLLPDLGKFTFSFERVFCDQFVLEEWQTTRRLFEGKMVEF